MAANPHVSESGAREFWGHLHGEEFASAAMERFESHADGLRSTRRHNRMRRSWLMYYSLASDGSWAGDGTEVEQGGVQGELTLIKPNHYRNLIQHQLNLVTQAKPSFEVVATNSDSESLSQALLGNGILDYYHKVNALDEYRKERAEIALLFGESWISARWDPSAGDVVAVEDRELEDGSTEQRPVYEGDFTFRVSTPYDVAYDPLSPNKNQPRWLIVREPANRWDLIAQYPHAEQQIRELSSLSDGLSEWDYVSKGYQHDDWVAVYWIYMERSPALPNGRMACVLDGETVLFDGDLPYERAPVFRLAPSPVVMASGGYTNNFDLLPVVQAYHAQHSTILSNHTAFGVQHIAAQKGSNVKPHQLGRGLSLIEYSGDQVPQPINFTYTPPEVFTYLDILRREMETLSVINAAVRGDPEATKGDSGSKAALIHSTAQQFSTGFAGALADSESALATHLLFTLRSHAHTKRVATIAGKFNSYASKEFMGADLENVSRVIVHQANPLKDTLAGKMELADKLMQFPDGLATADQYEMFLRTGRREPMLEGGLMEVMLVRRENEDLVDPEAPEPMVAPTDNHATHMDEHKAKLADPAVRRDPQIVARIQAHMAWHLESVTPGAPRFAGPWLVATGQAPLPMPGAGGPPGGPGGGPPPANDNGKPSDGMPEMPRPPVNPATGERVDAPVPDKPAMGG